LIPKPDGTITGAPHNTATKHEEDRSPTDPSGKPKSKRGNAHHHVPNDRTQKKWPSPNGPHKSKPMTEQKTILINHTKNQSTVTQVYIFPNNVPAGTHAHNAIISLPSNSPLRAYHARTCSKRTNVNTRNQGVYPTTPSNFTPPLRIPPPRTPRPKGSLAYMAFFLLVVIFMVNTNDFNDPFLSSIISSILLASRYILSTAISKRN
jgi:hypothetical protein